MKKYRKMLSLPIWEKHCPGDNRPPSRAGRGTGLAGGNSQAALCEKNIILNECHAAARTCGQAAATSHTPTHSLGLA